MSTDQPDNAQQPPEASNGQGPIPFPGKPELNVPRNAVEKMNAEYEAIKDTPQAKAARSEFEAQQKNMRWHSMLNDFTFYMSILYFNEYCHRNGAAEKTAELTVDSWRNRVLNSCGGNPSMLMQVGPDLEEFCGMLKKVSGIPFQLSPGAHKNA